MGNINMFFKFIANQFQSYRKERANKKKLSYYYTNVTTDERSNTAKVLDFTIWRMLLFFMLFMFLYVWGLNILLATILTTIILTAIHYFSIRVRNHRIENMKAKKRRYVASQKVLRELLDQTTDELREYMEWVFGRIGFENFSCIRRDPRQILLKSMYSGEEYMLLLNICKGDYYVELKDIKEFLRELTEHRTKGGIIITTSDFTEGAINYLNQLNETYKLVLLNKDQFLNILENCGLFPKDEEIDELIMNKISQKEKRWAKYKKSLLSQKKSKGYFWLSLYIIVVAYYTPYTYYYMFVGALTLVLACITALLNFKNRENKDEEKWVDINKILKDL